MKKIILTESQLISIINEGFSESLIQDLTDKFQSEQPGLDPKIIRYFIKRFEELKNTTKIEEKDINKYTWKELKYAIDVNQAKDPKPIDEEIKIDDSKLIYRRDGLKIIRANSRVACVKYGTGYNFCVSSRGDENRYREYRTNYNFTIYFVIDETKSKKILTRTPKLRFFDPDHLLILMVRRLQTGELEYQITTANNDHDKLFKDWSTAILYQPKLMKLQKLFIPLEELSRIDQIENQIFDLTFEYNKRLKSLEKAYKDNLGDLSYIPMDVDQFPLIQNLLKNKTYYKYHGYNESGRRITIGVRINYVDPDQWKYKYNKDNEIKLKVVKITEEELTPIELEYFERVKNIIVEYFDKKNKLNYS